MNSSPSSFKSVLVFLSAPQTARAHFLASGRQPGKEVDTGVWRPSINLILLFAYVVTLNLRSPIQSLCHLMHKIGTIILITQFASIRWNNLYENLTS